MSDIEFRPALREYFRSLIMERLPELRGYLVARKPRFMENPMPSPIKTVSEGLLFGIRVLCEGKSIRDVVKYLMDERKALLIETHAYRSGDGFLGVFILYTDKEKNIWSIAGKIADIDGVDTVEVLKTKRANPNVFINSFMYPPFLSREKTVLVPVGVFEKILETMDTNEVRSLAEEVGNLIKGSVGNRLSPELAIQVIDALGLLYIASIETVDGQYVVRARKIGDGRTCLFAKSLASALVGYDIALASSDDICILYFRQ